MFNVHERDIRDLGGGVSPEVDTVVPRGGRDSPAARHRSRRGRAGGKKLNEVGLL